jgi:hypothetical protein
MLLLFAAAGTALAWGPDGHRTVCEIAYLRLDHAHQKEVNRLHWVGDIHQPLHVSYADDQGGNKIKPIDGGLYTSKALHSVWGQRDHRQ